MSTQASFFATDAAPPPQDADPALRLSVLVPNAPGELATLSKAIFEAGGNIMALGTFLGE